MTGLDARLMEKVVEAFRDYRKDARAEWLKESDEGLRADNPHDKSIHLGMAAYYSGKVDAADALLRELLDRLDEDEIW